MSDQSPSDGEMTSSRMQADGWSVVDAKSERLYHFVRNHPVPRPYGFLDQLKCDLRAPLSLLMWVGAVTFLAIAIIERRPLMLVFPILCFWFFGATFLRLRRINRYGQLLTIHANDIIREWGKVALLSGRVQLGDGARDIEVCIERTVAKGLLEKHGAMEIRALVDVDNIDNKRDVNNIGIAFRAPKSEIH